ncbi:MAG: HDOD domain-containing protein [Rhodocyclaceae bacterium]|nr:HDOD domain-containing protein [Rhodocyclaceae bacterium]
MDDNPQLDKTADALKAQRFHMLEDIARELSAGDISFPTCFDAALQVRNVLKDANVSLRAVAQVVSLEPLVVTKLLRIANSVTHNQSGKLIVDVESALNRLGIEAARSIALAVAMDQLLRSRDLSAFADLSKDLWTHVLRTAAAASVLARTHTRINRDDAMLAGLVHDLGAFYMLYRAAQYEELRIRPDTVRHLIVQWHESIGESLMTVLGLPEHIIAAVREHDQPRPPVGELRTLSDVIYVANMLAGGIEEWSRTGTLLAEQHPELLNEAYVACLGDIETEFQSLKGALS